MTISVKSLFAGAAIISALVATSSASALTVIKPLIAPAGPYSLSNPIGTIPATVMAAGNTYDFTFTLVEPLDGVVASTQIAAQKLVGSVSTPYTIQYSLYEGTPGSGTFVSQSTLDFSPTISFSATPGDYYVEIDKVTKLGETVGGTLTLASVPEPATWGMMLVGFGMLGGVMRRRAAKPVAA